ncbi:MAG: hypothetical protein R2712_02225 [Vicinamibacterales bacterium]
MMRAAARAVMAFLAGGAVAWALWAILSPLLPPLRVAATLVLLALLMGTLHVIARWAESRGWIYYQQRQGSWDAVSAAISDVHAIYRPGARYVRRLQEDMHVYEEDDDQGDGPVPGRARRGSTGRDAR